MVANLFREWLHAFPNILTLLALGAIVAATLSLRALLSAETAGRFQAFSPLLPWGPSNELDALRNVVLYIPLGWGFSAWLRSQGRRGPTLYVAGLAVCFGLSYALECLQVLTPGRKAAFADVLANVGGGAAGMVVARVIATRNPFPATVAYVVTLVAVAIPLQRTTTFWNWDDRSYLVLGNEATGNRGWNGRISGFLIANQPMTAKEAIDLLLGKGSGAREETVIARFLLPQDEDCRESVLPIFRLAGSGTLLPLPCSNLSSSRYLQTATPAAEITQKLAETSRLSLFVQAATSNVEQYGPTRILTLSRNADERNFTLAQDGSSLVFRLRTPVSGNNGSRPELVIPNVFADTGPKDILANYDGTVLRVAVNGREADQTLEFSPGMALITSIAEPRQEWMWLYRALLYAIGFGLLGAGLALLTRSYGARSSRFKSSFAVALVATVVLEIVLVLVSSRPLQLENIGIAILFLLIPLAIGYAASLSFRTAVRSN